MVRIADRVWRAWRALAEEFDEPAMLMMLSPAGDLGEAARAVREVIQELDRANQAATESSGESEPPFVGEWSSVRVSAGVLVQVVECDELESVLPALAAGLERRGIEGVFDLHEGPAVATTPMTAHLLECRVRVRGERLRRAPHAYAWQPDPDAQKATLEIADRWCRQHAQDAAGLLSSGITAPVPVSSDEDVIDRMLDDVFHVELSALRVDEFRTVARRAHGGISLVVGGVWVDGGAWRRLLAELTAFLRHHAHLLAYGYVKRGWAFDQARLRPSLPDDWPPRTNHQPGGIHFTDQAFDDAYAPDAFGVQLLGPGYAGRVPAGPDWREEQVGHGAVLLQHVDLPAWFDAPFVPYDDRGPYAEEPEPPPVLARAREDLAPILYSPGALSRGGYVAEEEEL